MLEVVLMFVLLALYVETKYHKETIAIVLLLCCTTLLSHQKTSLSS